jgi:hypothetical protein
MCVLVAGRWPHRTGMFCFVALHALTSPLLLLLSLKGCFVLLKNKTTLSIAALALAGGTAMLAMPAANAATIRCGNGCDTLASQKYGAGNVMAVGASSSGVLAPFWYNQNEDFVAEVECNVHDLYKVGVIAGSVNRTYSSDEVYQYVYAPVGNTTDKCLGAAPGSTAVTLMPCGTNADTLWVGLSGLQHGNFMPVMSAALSPSSAMLLTASAANGPLTVTQMNLSTTTSNGVTTASVAANQAWETVQGAYGSSSINADRG